MAVDPTTPDPLGAGQQRDILRRLEALERANKLLASTIKGGALNVLDDNGAPVVIVGELPNGFVGLQMFVAGGTLPILQADQTNGFGVPWFSTGWRQYLASAIVTSGTFVTTWVTLTELLYATQMLFRVGVTVDAATTGEMQIYHTGSSSVLGTVRVLPASTAVLYEFRFVHGLDIGTGPHEFYLQVRRTSGAGNITVYNPGSLHYGTNMGAIIGGWA